jgi:hypothetical protein
MAVFTSRKSLRPVLVGLPVSGDFAPGMPAIRDDDQKHQREQDPEKESEEHDYRLGRDDPYRFAGCANELPACACPHAASCLVRCAPRAKIDGQAEALDSVLADRFA